ncbi:MAG: hypothetical protein NUV56_02560 [Candidatus Uhrbacteria bacterium]|nr:hypothetical protein [Candidatus Uhrbacteria bacterium]
MVSFLLLSSLATAADPLDLSRAIPKVIHEGVLAIDETYNYEVMEGDTTVPFPVAFRVWGYEVTECSYKHAAMLYMAGHSPEKSVVALLAAVQAPDPNGGFVNYSAIDLNFDGIVDDVEIDGHITLSRELRQDLFDRVLTCVLNSPPVLQQPEPQLQPIPIWQPPPSTKRYDLLIEI